MRACSKCGVEKSLDDFHRNKNCPLGRSYRCKVCALALASIWTARPENRARARANKDRYNATEHGKAMRAALQKLPKHKAKAKARRERKRAAPGGQRREFELLLRRCYGISVEDWARMFNEQDGCCAGCSNPLVFGRATHVDHDHSTGVVRGLLCRGCNLALGGTCDSPATLRSLATYLESRC